MKFTFLILNTFIFSAMISCGNKTKISANQIEIGNKRRDISPVIVDHNKDSCEKIARSNSEKYELIASCNELVLNRFSLVSEVKKSIKKPVFEVSKANICIFKYKKHQSIVNINFRLENSQNSKGNESSRFNVTSNLNKNDHISININQNGVHNIIKYNKRKKILTVKQKKIFKRKLKKRYLRNFIVRCSK